MWLYLIMGICTSIIGIYPMTFQLLMIVSFFFMLSNFSKFKPSNLIDFFTILFIVWIMINSITIDYSNHWKMWYTSLMSNILPMSFYFIAKTVNYDIENILEKATIPIVVAMIFGLIFYYIEPSWYVAIKMRQIYAATSNGEISDELLIEMFRLSSFWVTPYVIGYATMYYGDFVLHKLFSETTNKKDKNKYFLLFTLCAIIILLTQFRATIYALVLTIIYLMFFAKNKIKISYIILIITSGFFILTTVLDEETDTGANFRERMMKGFDKEHVESRLEFTGGGVDMHSVCGNGFGRYGSIAKSVNNEWPIVDSEYQKIMAELGILGIILFAGLLICGLLMSFRNKNLQLEFIIIAFFTVAFVGSSCISAETTFPFIFWYVLGRISHKSSKSYKKLLRNGNITY